MTAFDAVLVTTTFVVFGTMGAWGTLAALRPARWVRPIDEHPPLDPEWAMERLIDQIALSPARSRGCLPVAGVKITAWWITDIEIRPNGDGGWTSGRWILDIDGQQEPCADLDVLYQVGLARLRAIAAARGAS